MKFINLNTKTLLVIFAIIFTISVSFINSYKSHSRTELKMHNKNQSKNAIKARAHLHSRIKSKSKIHSRKYSSEEYEEVDPLNPAGSVKPTAAGKPAKVPEVGATKGKGEVVLNDWFRVSSKSFRNKYNEIDMGHHGPAIKIRVDAFDFRINDAFGKDNNKDNQPAKEDEFWFRLTKDLVFYSSTKQDMNLLGGMRLEDIIEADGEKKNENNEYCFVIGDVSNHTWEVCSKNEKMRNEWFCKIETLRKIENKPEYCSTLDNSNTKIITKNVRK